MEYPLSEITYNDIAMAADAIGRRMPEDPRLPNMSMAYAMTLLNILIMKNPTLAGSVIAGEARARWLDTRVPENTRLQLDTAINTAIIGLRQSFAMASHTVQRMHAHAEHVSEHLVQVWDQLAKDVPASVRRNPSILHYIESDPHAEEIVAARITLAIHSARAVTLGVMQAFVI